MTRIEPQLLVRGGALYLAVVLTALVLILRRPRVRDRAGMWLAFCWNLPSLLVLQLAAAKFHWWSFSARGGLILGMPVDLYLVWAWVWAVPAIALPSSRLVVAIGIPVVFDVVLMPLGSPTVMLAPHWLTGEEAAVALVLIPAQLLARWTARDDRLTRRAMPQILAFAGLIAFVFARDGDRRCLDVRNPWIAVAGLMAHVYSIGIAGWDEDTDLRERFGAAWTEYRQSVRRWWPRWRPWRSATQRPSTLYVSETCGMCSQVGAWFLARGASHLLIAPAESHPSRALTRISYESGDGTEFVSDIRALARALEHVHFGWAFVGAFLRLPILAALIQVLVDGSGGEARGIQGSTSAAAATRALDQAH